MTLYVRRSTPVGGEVLITSAVDFGISYPTGGESLSTADLGFATPPSLVIPISQDGFEFHYDNQTEKLLAYVTGLDSSQPFTYAVPDSLACIYQTSLVTDAGATDVTPLGGLGSLVHGTGQDCLAGTDISFSTPVTVGDLVAGDLPVLDQPALPCTLTVYFGNDSGGSLDMYEGTTTVSIVGTFRGEAQSEDVLFTCDAGHKAVADQAFRVVLTTKPFSEITSITVTNLPAAGLAVGVAAGGRFGLPIASDTGGYSDISVYIVDANVKDPEAANDLDDGGGVNVDIDNQTFITAGSGSTTIIYAIDLSEAGPSVGPAIPLAEVPAGTDLSSIVGVNILAWGSNPI